MMTAASRRAFGGGSTRVRVALLCGVVCLGPGLAGRARAEEGLRGRVVDAESRRPIAGAVVTTESRTIATTADGGFEVPAGTSAVLVRAVGYRRSSADPRVVPVEIALAPLRAKALYLSFYGIGSATLRTRALDILDRTELNALVIDVKGDAGKMPYPTTVPLALAIGAERPFTIPDPIALISQLRARGIYLIARIVVFKDQPLATARPDLAVRTANGDVFHDREHLAWTDPFRTEVRDYNVDIAVEAARLGFDEIQFDYVRFPDAAGLRYAEPSTQASRIGAIADLVREARRRLAPYNVFLSADVFGYVCWNHDDTLIGQRIEDLAPLVDYLSPMLYPSAFQFGIPGYRDPVAHPFEIVHRSLEEAQRRTGLPGVRFRPWLQAFKDYAFDRRVFGPDEVRKQIRAADGSGSGGWMLWNPRNDYAATGLAE